MDWRKIFWLQKKEWTFAKWFTDWEAWINLEKIGLFAFEMCLVAVLFGLLIFPLDSLVPMSGTFLGGILGMAIFGLMIIGLLIGFLTIVCSWFLFLGMLFYPQKTKWLSQRINDFCNWLWGKSRQPEKS
jgi:hypothetical protein